MGFRSALSRLGVPASQPDRMEGDILSDLRAKMDALLSKPATPPSRAPVAPWGDFCDTLDTPHGSVHRRVHRFSPSHRVGTVSIDAAMHSASEQLALLSLSPGVAACDVSRALYLDTETTGLSGGTGTVPFLVGLGCFEDKAFVVEQLFLKRFGEEEPLLRYLAERVSAASLLVTFNGKSFDLPLLRTRLLLSRLPVFDEKPHLDLLHMARRIHKHRKTSTRLVDLESTVLGFGREGDMESASIGSAYLHFLRTGDTTSLVGIANHNQWDIVSMAALVALYGETPATSDLGADDLAGIALTLKRAGAKHEAHHAVSAALRKAETPHVLLADARIAKARGERDRALLRYERLLGLAPDPAVRLELAKLYEHHLRAPARALALVAEGTSETPPQREKRVRRLERKVQSS